MVCCGRICFGILILLTVGVSVAQIAFGVHYIHKPVKCERSEFLTYLTLAGGCSSILSIVFILCCCHGSGFGSKSSNPDQDKQQIINE